MTLSGADWSFFFVVLPFPTFEIRKTTVYLYYYIRSRKKRIVDIAVIRPASFSSKDD